MGAALTIWTYEDTAPGTGTLRGNCYSFYATRTAQDATLWHALQQHGGLYTYLPHFRSPPRWRPRAPPTFGRVQWEVRRASTGAR